MRATLCAADVLTTVRARRHWMRRSARMPSGSRFNNVTRGDSGGNAVTGRTAAPSGR